MACCLVVWLACLLLWIDMLAEWFADCLFGWSVSWLAALVLAHSLDCLLWRVASSVDSYVLTLPLLLLPARWFQANTIHVLAPARRVSKRPYTHTHTHTRTHVRTHARTQRIHSTPRHCGGVAQVCGSHALGDIIGGERNCGSFLRRVCVRGCLLR